MQDITDDILSGYLDGELDETRRAEVQAEIARNPALAQRLAALREADALTREAFSGVGARDVPQSLLHTLSDTPDTQRRFAWSWFRMPSLRLPTAPAPAMAMGLVAGLALSLLLQLPLGSNGSGDGPATVPSDPLYPMEPLDGLTRVLNTKPSGTLHAAGNVSVMVLKTFRSDSGRVCREYKVYRKGANSSVAMAGVACRADESGWNNETMKHLMGPGPELYADGSGLKSTRAIWRGAEVFTPEEERALLQQWST